MSILSHTRMGRPICVYSYGMGFAKFTLLDVESRDFVLGRHKKQEVGL